MSDETEWKDHDLHPGGEPEPDRECRQCGEKVSALSTDDLCDGCVAENAHKPSCMPGELCQVCQGDVVTITTTETVTRTRTVHLADIRKVYKSYGQPVPDLASLAGHEVDQALNELVGGDFADDDEPPEFDSSTVESVTVGSVAAKVAASATG